MMENKTKLTQYSFLVFFILFLYLSWRIIQPYISYIITGIIFIIIFYPLQKKLKKILKTDIGAAIIIVLLTILLIIIPSYYLGYLILNQSQNIYLGIDALKALSNTINSMLGSNIAIDNIAVYLIEFTRKIIGVDNSKIINSITDVLTGMFISIVILFYGLLKGESIYEWLKKYLPLKRKHRHEMLEEIDKSIKGFIYGQILAALAQGVMVSLGFYMFGLSNALFWGFIAFIFSLLPIIGAPFVWIPGVVVLVVNGSILKGILLALWGLIVVSNIDNVVRIYIMRSKANIHELIVLLGLIGGIKMFGFIGILLGPLILKLLLLLIRFYVEEYGEYID